MTDTIVSFRVDKHMHSRMRELTQVNWSAVLRKTVEEHVNHQPSAREDISAAIKDAAAIRKARLFDKVKTIQHHLCQ